MKNDSLKVGEHAFELTCSKLIVSDPGYILEDAGAVVENVNAGRWVLMEEESENEPRPALAVHEAFADKREAFKWKPVFKDIGSDGGIVGVYDAKHFRDDGVVSKDQKWSFEGGPADPESLWYSLNCEVLMKARDRGWGLAGSIPYGFVCHWDGLVAVEIAKGKVGDVVGLRLRFY